MSEVARLTAVLDADIGGFRRAMDSANRDIDSTQRNLSSLDRKFATTGNAGSQMGRRIGTGMKIAAAAIATVGIAAGIGAAVGMKKSIDAASDLNETVSKTKVIFGRASGDVLKWSKTSAKALGQSRTQALDAASTFATFGKSAGLGGKDLSGFAQELTGLSADLASFYNSSPEEAIVAIGAALRGESEPIRRFGVLLDDASLRAEALKQGLIESTKEALTPQQKVLASHALILKQTKDAQGDFARTSGGLANQQRIFNAELENAKAEIGKSLLPLATAILPKITAALPVVTQYAKAFVEKIVEIGSALAGIFGGMGDMQAQAQSIFGQMGAAIESFVTPIRDAFQALAADPKTVVPIMDALRTAMTTIGTVAETVGPALGQYLGDSIRTLGKVAAAVAPIISDAFRTIGPTIGPLIVAIANLGSKIQHFLGTVVPPIVRALAPVFSVAFRAIAEVIKAVTAILEGDWRGALEHLVKIPYTILSGLAGIFASLIGKAASGIARGVKALWDALTSALSDLASQALAKAGEIGRAIIQGIVDAIMASPGAIKDALRSVLGGAIDFAKGILGISSPSKVFRFLGDMTMQGYLDGLADKEQKVSESIVGAIEKGTNDAVRAVNRGIGLVNNAMPYLQLNAQAKINLEGISNPETVLARFEKIKQSISGKIDAALGGGTGGLGAMLGRFTNNLLRAYDAQTQAGVRGIQQRLDAALRGINDRYKAAENAARAASQATMKGIEAGRAALTPAEAALEAERAAQDGRRREQEKADAQEALRIAQIRGNATEIADATRRLADLENEERIAGLEKTAAEERAQRDADADAAIEAEQTRFDEWLAQHQANQEAELQSQRDAYAREQVEYEAAREVMRAKREDELARMTDNLTRRNGSVRSKLRELQRITKGPLAAAIAASGGELGSAFAASLGTSEKDIQKAVRRIGKLLKAYLQLNSPAEKGPLSTLDSWWTAMPDTLLGGVDTSMIGQVAASIAAPDLTSGASGAASPSASPVIVQVTVQGSVTAEQDLAETIRRELIKTGQRNGTIFGGIA